MHTKSIALTIAALCALAAGVPGGAAAAQAPRPLKAITITVPAPVAKSLGAAGATTIAVRTRAGTVVLLGENGTRRTLAARPGCTADAAGAELIAWDCTDTTVVTDLAGAVRGTIPRPHDAAPAIAEELGAQWIQFRRTRYDHRLNPLVWANWHTGAQADVDWRNPAAWADLDATALPSAFCPGVRAQLTPVAGSGGGNVRPVQYRAPYALVDERAGTSVRVRHILRRCGTGRAVRVPSTLTTGNAVLGARGWVAWVPLAGGTLDLLRAGAPGRTYVLATSLIDAPVFTRGAVWGQTDGDRLVRVTLPAR